VAYFLFPVYNEGPNLPRLHDDLQTFARWTSEAGGTPRFVFVDDGSGDGTAAGIRAWGIPDLTLLAHPINRGPGAAFQTGFAHVLSQGLRPTDLVVTLEADATSDPVLFGRMLHRVCCEGDDVVLASPYLYGGGFSNVTPARAFVSHVGNFGVKLFLGIRGIATFSCFYRIYSGRALGALARAYGPDRIVTRSGFECALELLLKSVRCGLSISEVPFRVDWARRKGGSKMRLLRTTLAYLRLFARGV
jgi:glycosyltransferase involved in cell wall biosynthesis